MNIFQKYFKELILLFTILLDIFGFFGLIRPEFEILDKIIAWIVFAYFFYELSISKLFFGKKNKTIDIVILFAYYNLISKNFIVFLADIINNITSEPLINIISWILAHAANIEVITFYLGGLIILFVSYLLSLHVDYTKKSLFSRLLGEDKIENQEYIGAKEKKSSTFKKIFILFILFNFFFIIIFNLFVEWLGFIEDDLITVFSIVILLVLIKMHKQDLKISRIIERITNIADDFYGNIVASINNKSYFKLLFTGILSLQILTDFLIFIYPLILGKNEISYFGALSGHSTLIDIILNDISLNIGIWPKLSVILIYSLDAIFITFLMIMPIYIWYITYTEKKEKIPNYLIVLFFMSLVSFAVKPILVFKSIDAFSGGIHNVFGVDIIIQGLMPLVNINIVHIFFITLLTGILIASLLKVFKKFILFIFTLVNYGFILVYVYFFISGALSYYYTEISMLVELGHFFIALYFIFFMCMILLFYISSIIFLASEINQEFGFISYENKDIRNQDIKTKEFYSPMNYESFMKEHPMLKHLKLYTSVMIVMFFVFLSSVLFEVEEITGKISFSTNFIVEDFVLLAFSFFAIISILYNIRKMRDKYFDKNHFIKRNINKKIFPISFAVLLFGVSVLLMAVRDKSRAFNILEFSVDKDWIHVVLITVIFLFYLYLTFIINKGHNKKK